MEIKKIYFDMDGVLADFDRGTKELANFENISQNEKRPKDFDDKLWEALKKVPHFYWQLEPMPGAIELFRQIYEEFGDKCEILTGIPKPERGIVTAKEDKEKWVAKYLSEDVKVHAVLRKDKVNYCTGKDCILIDDYLKNVNEWEKNGGTGIAFENSEQAMAALKRIQEDFYV